MRTIVACCLLLAVALPGRAQQKPNTLTPKEIADGWILLFDGATTFGWTFKGTFDAAEGALILTGAERAEAYHATAWGNFELQLEYRLEEKKGAAFVAVEDRSAASLTPGKGGWYHLRLNYDFDATTEQYVSQTKVEFPDQASRMGGRVAQKRQPNSALTPRVGIQVLGDARLEVRNVKLKPVKKTAFDPQDQYTVATSPLPSLFNGKDLDGWKVFPNKKSKFAVVDGAINVKDGPGDLQTVGKYKDFILQLDCISNGKHLNSGIFFRCREGEYQNGYEAQIRNEFTEKATQKYQIEEYDSKTNKLIGKKEQFFSAVDFGTGAIYRRQPARKQMSKDNEWFGMTIVAQGNHLATWVNGVQVTDWYDNRPKIDNARTGCKLEAGHISIQGHDPTTNLSFKNFRIAELPSAKQ